MIDFHIHINANAMQIGQAMLYAKNASLRAFALMTRIDHVPYFNPTESANTNSPLDASPSANTLAHDTFCTELMRLQTQVKKLSIYHNVQAFFGIELYQIPPALLADTINAYRTLKLDIIGVHGESITDIVEEGTNFAACNAKADILFNPGLIDDTCVELAAKNNVFLEISTHKNHAYCNAHIAFLAKKHKAKLLLGSSATCLEEIHHPDMQKQICQGACILMKDIHMHEILQKIQNINL